MRLIQVSSWYATSDSNISIETEGYFGWSSYDDDGLPCESGTGFGNYAYGKAALHLGSVVKSLGGGSGAGADENDNQPF